MRTAVIIPVFGMHAYTAALWQDLSVENVDVFIVDNRGDYVENGRESAILKPGHNLGWLRGSNLGLESAGQADYDAYCLLNNDVRLSHGFFEALSRAVSQRDDVGVVGPSYDQLGGCREQHCGWFGPAREFAPRDELRRVGAVDGTCMFITRRTLNNVGYLDDRFSRFGWGAETDWCIRIKLAGHKVLVTAGAYLNHFEHTTAYTVHGAHEELATEVMTRELEKKWGPAWPHLRNAHDPTNFDFVWFFVKDVPGWCSHAEAEALWKAARNAAGAVVQTGCYVGRESLALGAAGEVTCLDPFQSDPPFGRAAQIPSVREQFLATTGASPWKRNFNVIPCLDSLVYPAWKRPVGLLLVGHRRAAVSVEKSLAGWRPHVSKQGVVAVQDCGDCEITNAIQASGLCILNRVDGTTFCRWE